MRYEFSMRLRQRRTPFARVRSSFLEACEERLLLSGTSEAEASWKLADASATPAADSPGIAFTVMATDGSGAELTRDGAGRYVVTPGSTVQADVYVDDLRVVGNTGGVYSAFATGELSGSSFQFDTTAGIAYGVGFDLAPQGSISSSGFQNVGALRSSLIPPGDLAQHLFSVTVQTSDFAADGSTGSLILLPGDSPPTRSNLVFGLADGVTGSYVGAQFVVVAHPWTNIADPTDVNADGRTTLSDLVQIVNRLLAVGPGPIGVPTVSDHPPGFLDPTGDGQVTQSDLLAVVNSILASTVTPLAQQDGEGSPLTAYWLTGDEEDADSDEPILCTDCIDFRSRMNRHQIRHIG